MGFKEPEKVGERLKYAVGEVNQNLQHFVVTYWLNMEQQHVWGVKNDTINITTFI